MAISDGYTAIDGSEVEGRDIDLLLEPTPVEAAVVVEGDRNTSGWTSTRFGGALGHALKRPGFLAAIAFLLFVLVTAIFPSLVSGYGSTAVIPTDKLQGPRLSHLFGTDQLGRDLWSRLIDGSRGSITAVLAAVVLAAVVGLLIGIVSGFFGGVTDSVLMRAVDVVLAIPPLLSALTIVTVLGFGTIKVAVAVGVAMIPGFARVTRSEVLRIKTLPYVEAARSSGAGWSRVLSRHILPNSWAPVTVLVVLDMGTAVLAIATLSFLGFGAQPPAADWGSLISDGRDYLITSPWLSLLPGIFVGLVVFSLNHIGKTMEELGR